ncbi:MAG TPA: ribonuclease HII [Chloroflexota bacterium]|nr:ribonuclease HII [Chloroflexota bacterium]
MRPRTSPHYSSPESPTLVEEHSLASQGFCRIAGLDEAGRGSWAGPMVTAAVCLPLHRDGLAQQLDGVRDSKQLSPAARDRLFGRVIECAEDVGIGVVPPETIDKLGLTRAWELAMTWALDDMALRPDHLLVDAFLIKTCPLPQRPLIHGDCISLSIAAASIIAKVTRDRMMVAADLVYPGYGFAIHKGYGTAAHRRALEAGGPCAYHRRSFAPLRNEWRLPL